MLENGKTKDIPLFYLENLRPKRERELDRQKFAILRNIDEKLDWIKRDVAKAAEINYQEQIEICKQRIENDLVEDHKAKITKLDNDYKALIEKQKVDYNFQVEELNNKIKELKKEVFVPKIEFTKTECKLKEKIKKQKAKYEGFQDTLQKL